MAVFNKLWHVKILFLRSPFQITRLVVKSVFVSMNHSMLITWSRAMKGLTHQLMNLEVSIFAII